MIEDIHWTRSISKENWDEISKKTKEFDKLFHDSNSTLLAQVDLPLDMALNELYSEKHLSFENWKWCEEIGYPIIDHPLVISENLIILYPYHIKNDQLIELITKAQSNGYKVDIDGFAHKKQYDVRIIIYKTTR